MKQISTFLYLSIYIATFFYGFIPAGNIFSVQKTEAATGTATLNVAPVITSYSGQSQVSVSVNQNQTFVANITATDTLTNTIGEYGTTSLSGNTWQNI